MRILLSLLDELTTSSLQVTEKRVCLGGLGLPNVYPAPIPSAPFWPTECEFQGLVHRARVSLVAQIIAADEISDHLDAGWPQRKIDWRFTAHKVAERSLRAWADKHPTRPRCMARVGARLLAISRLYPYNMPREPYDAFRAGLLLWTILPLVRYAGAPEHARQVCQLDWLGAEDSAEARTIREWIERGGDDFVLRVYGISNICTQQGSRQILQQTFDLLRKLQVWGLSQMYREIILRALSEADGY